MLGRSAYALKNMKQYGGFSARSLQCVGAVFAASLVLIMAAVASQSSRPPEIVAQRPAPGRLMRASPSVDGGILLASTPPPNHTRNTTAWLRSLIPNGRPFHFESIVQPLQNGRQESDSSARVTDEMLIRDVTIIMTYKETVNAIKYALPALVSSVPRMMSIIAVVGGPCNDCRMWVDEFVRVAVETGIAPRLRLMHVEDFLPSLAARRRAVPLVESKYALFMNNDCFLAHPSALRELYAAAEWKEPSGTLFAPFISEMRHGAATGMHGNMGGMVFTVGSNGVADMQMREDARRAALDTTAFPNGTLYEALSGIEDHVLLIRHPQTSVSSIFDPSAALGQEFVDTILNLRYAGMRAFEVFDSWWLLGLTDGASIHDLPYVAWRRSDYMAAATIYYISQKWSIHIGYSGFHFRFRMTSLKELSWSTLSGSAPSEGRESAVAVVAMSALIGFNSFVVSVGDRVVCNNTLWHETYQTLADVCDSPESAPESERLHDREASNVSEVFHGKDVVVTVNASLALRRHFLPNTFNDNAQRAKAVQAGKFGRLIQTNATYELMPSREDSLFFPDIVAVHVRGLPYSPDSNITRAVIDESAMCWSCDGKRTMQCLLWFSRAVSGAAEVTAAMSLLTRASLHASGSVGSSAPAVHVSLTERKTLSPLTLMDGPVWLFSAVKVTIASSTPAAIAAAVAMIVGIPS
eukprot:Opistho-2@8131